MVPSFPKIWFTPGPLLRTRLAQIMWLERSNCSHPNSDGPLHVSDHLFPGTSPCLGDPPQCHFALLTEMTLTPVSTQHLCDVLLPNLHMYRQFHAVFQTEFYACFTLNSANTSISMKRQYGSLLTVCCMKNNISKLPIYVPFILN